MIKLTEKYLIEDIEAVRRQFSHIPADEFDRIIRIDPTFDEGRDSVGKYGKWLLGLYNKDRANLTNAVKDIISEYDSLKNDRRYNIEKDIMKFKSIQDMQNAIDNVQGNELSKSQRSKQDKKDKNYDLVFEGKNYYVFVPKNHSGNVALASYGHSKKAVWCTAADSGNGEARWDEYCESGHKLFVLINKEDNNKKIQYSWWYDELRDEENCDINRVEFCQENPDIEEYFIKIGQKIDCIPTGDGDQVCIISDYIEKNYRNVAEFFDAFPDKINMADVIEYEQHGCAYEVTENNIYAGIVAFYIVVELGDGYEWCENILYGKI